MPGIIPSQEIAARVEAENIIENADLTGRLSPASYELRAGTFINAESRAAHSIPDPGGQIFPRYFALIGTIEKVNMPRDLAGTLYLKSSLGRIGLTPWSQGFVDPGYSGVLTIALHNPYNQFIIIGREQPICHIVFHELSHEAERGYEGEYQGASGPTAPAQQRPIDISYGLATSAVQGFAAGAASALLSGGGGGG